MRVSGKRHEPNQLLCAAPVTLPGSGFTKSQSTRSCTMVPRGLMAQRNDISPLLLFARFQVTSANSDPALVQYTGINDGNIGVILLRTTLTEKEIHIGKRKHYPMIRVERGLFNSEEYGKRSNLTSERVVSLRELQLLPSERSWTWIETGRLINGLLHKLP
ncbi:hypothetical protein F2P81_025084 [Scophthalmus maximus]|uniref:Uncharacterized protein n=1 Tax=Scophthalmus maximus TaxID=52904 RepID=A0A6A4RUH6_SCOMX|nr:hypothetical protein F2P81_025084 [Scophthalmus maximus]